MNNTNNYKISLAELDILPESREMLQEMNIYIFNGGNPVINSKKMRDINNSSFGNANILADNNIQKVNIQENPEIASALKELSKIIETLDNERDIAEIYYESLVQAIEQNKPKRIETCLKKLKDFVGTFASITTIAKYFGIIIV